MWKPQPQPQPQPRRNSVSNKPDGWAAFDVKHRQKQGLVPPDDNSCDPFPPIVSTHAQPHHLRPFSSLLPQSQTQTHSSSLTATGSLYNRPKHHLHRSFTRHVVMDMEAVHDIIHNAADSSHVSQHTKISSLPVEPEWDGDHHQDLYSTLRQNAFTTFRSASQHSKAATNAFIRGDHFAAKQHSLKAQQQRLAAKKLNTEAAHDIIHNAADSSHVSQHTKISSLPVEPEWDGDHHQDLYLTLRQNAFTTSRSASQHSKAATNAFIRGDHFAAKQHSLKAQQQRLAAKKLNTEAAHDIIHNAADSSHVSQDTKISSLPVEPEWDGDHHQDLYLTLRQNAFTTFRSASQHSKAATNAFIRGDHFAAKQHSLKAQQQRLTAKKLNTEAAKEILSIRNSKNDHWKLDLHGLHAAEAIQVLKEHLQQIETQVYNSNRSLSPASVRMEGRIGCSSSLQSYTCMDVEKLATQHASSRQRPTSLQVITGVGNHSRGQAALPTAVRGFLSENGYHFEELRPGVITVRPKYRITSW